MASSHPSAPDWEPPLPEDLQRMLPQYEITGILGRGGMGAVYRGRQAKLNRSVAIKLLPETFSQGEDEFNFARRFEREAQAMANLDHPAIISVHDFGETAGGQLYFVMEFVDGMDIHQYLQHHGGKLSQEQAVNITAHVLDALAYAHDHGVVHRDIKPANILLNREGRVKIADFGLAKKSTSDTGNIMPALTSTSMAMGTPDYVAPEALDSTKTPDHRADLYAVGVTLYQMLTGKLPRGQFKSPSQISPEIDPRLDQIVSKALQTDPDDRYPSAAAVRADLDRILSQPMAHIVSGEDTARVPAAVPVTTTLKEAPAGEPRPRPAIPKPAARVTSKAPFYTVAALGAVLLVAVLAIAFTGGNDETAQSDSQPDKPTPPLTPAADSELTRATKDKPFENTLGMKFVPVPGTDVLFCIHEVRFKDYAAYAEENPGTDARWKTQTHDGFTIKDDAEAHPVVWVSWDDASAFCAWLSEKEGKTYRLPTDHEWSIAVGIGDEEDEKATPGEKDSKIAGVYPWGKGWPPPAGAGNYNGPSDGFPFTAPVMSFEANSFGLHDLDGNVCEYCVDWFDPVKADRRVVRGGAWQGSSPIVLCSSFRGSEPPSNRYGNRGFRVVMAVGGDPTQTTEPPNQTRSHTTSVRAIPPSLDAIDQSLALATKDRPFENTLGMKFVPVPKTDVLFCIHELRYKDYATYAKENPGTDAAWKDQTIDGFAITGEAGEHPVLRVSWDVANAFCAWLSKKEGKTYRLPTDHEWSVAVGIGDQEDAGMTPEAKNGKLAGVYPWEKGWPPPVGSGNYSDQRRRDQAPHPNGKYIEDYDDGFPTTAPVMSFGANRFGLYDLGGNVWEWCEDWFDPVKMDHRVVRGGAWVGDTEFNLRSSFRGQDEPAYRSAYGGFRVVVVVGDDLTETTRPRVQTPTPTTSDPAPPLSPDAANQLPASATEDEPFENSLGMQFVPVPIKGGPTAGKPVLFSIWETRVKDYAAFAAEKPDVDMSWKGVSRNGIKQEEDHPVVNVNWEDAQGFCAWLTEKERGFGKIGKEDSYRLPTDHEWSVAVGIGDQEDPGRSPVEKHEKLPGVYPWEKTFPPAGRVGNYLDSTTTDIKAIAGYYDGHKFVAPVASYTANRLGIYDLGGNVWEWCEDWFDPVKKEFRVTRGASWASGTESWLHSSYRGLGRPASFGDERGFRCVLEVRGSGS